MLHCDKICTHGQQGSPSSNCANVVTIHDYPYKFGCLQHFCSYICDYWLQFCDPRCEDLCYELYCPLVSR